MPDANPGAAPLVARRLGIHGRVQGVGYRFGAQSEAARLGLRGWVRNRRDGTVEALVIGPAPRVEDFIAWAHQGPPNAKVARIEINAADEEPADGFEQRPTA